MAFVLNTTTLELRASVNEGAPPYDSSPWVIITGAQYDLWGAIPQQYRKWVIDHIEEMSGPEKAAVDLARLEASRDAIIQQLDNIEDILRAFAGLLVDELNAHTSRTNALLTAIDNAASLAALKTAVATIQDLPTRTLVQLRAAIRAKMGT
jgi:hypothetical protein